ncbi:MAG: glycosyltransferase family 4 protein [Patescibacteria group bacterium]|nr:glycosyltransferase family 4 protein [Patescibacteria group bacterium]
MKIAIISCVFPPYKGGIGEVAYNYALLLSGFKHSVTVITPDYRQGGLENNPPFEVVKLKPLLKFGNAAFTPKLVFTLSKYDIVQLHYPFFGGAEMVWFSRIFNRRFKLLVHYHMDTISLSFGKRIFSLSSNLIKKSLFLRADKISCASLDYIKHSQIKNIFNSHPNKFVEIPFAVDMNKFFPVKTGSNNSSEKRIIFVGGLDGAHYYKGVGLLLEALSKINYNYRLTVIGDGDLRHFYEDKAAVLGIDKKICFLGGISDKEKIEYLKKSDLLILPSTNKHEAFGLVLLEAMACGLPVAASDLPGVRTVFENNKHGILFKPNNKFDLIKKLNLILSGELNLAKMGKAARKYAEIKYSQQKMGEKLNSLFMGSD